MIPRLGETAALLTAISWTITAISFQLAGQKVGSISVNLIRIILGFIFLTLFNWLFRGLPLPLDASASAWFWLSLSGFVGFFLGDLFLFQAYATIGARITTLMMAAVPPLTALFGWLFLDEILELKSIAGMIITIFGIAMVVFKPNKQNNSIQLTSSFTGLLMAFGGAMGQAGGLILSKVGVQNYHPVAATQIRIITAIPCFLILITILRAWPNVFSALHNKPAMGQITIGAFFGPFIGVSLSLLAVKYTQTGVASTIMALVPVFVIIPSALILKEKISLREVIGAIIAVIGIWLLFL
jgi:drug/metabolite transporter (DMT)-like permease